MESTDRKVRHQDKGTAISMLDLRNPFVKNSAQSSTEWPSNFVTRKRTLKVFFEGTTRMSEGSVFKRIISQTLRARSLRFFHDLSGPCCCSGSSCRMLCVELCHVFSQLRIMLYVDDMKLPL